MSDIKAFLKCVQSAAINPRGQIPALVDDGFNLAERYFTWYPFWDVFSHMVILFFFIYGMCSLLPTLEVKHLHWTFRNKRNCVYVLNSATILRYLTSTRSVSDHWWVLSNLLFFILFHMSPTQLRSMHRFHKLSRTKVPCHVITALQIAMAYIRRTEALNLSCRWIYLLIQVHDD